MPTHDQIECRAYELYEQRGRKDGHDCEDWWLAEAELRTAEAGAKSPAVRDLATAAGPQRRRSERAQKPAAS